MTCRFKDNGLLFAVLGLLLIIIGSYAYYDYLTTSYTESNGNFSIIL